VPRRGHDRGKAAAASCATRSGVVLRGGCCRSDPLLLRPTSLRRHRPELRRRRLADRRLGHGRSAHCGKGRTWFVPRGGREGALAPQLSLPPASGLLDSRHPCGERRILSTRDRGRFSRWGRGLTASGARAPAPGLSSRGQLKPRGSARCRSKAEHGQRLLGLGSAFAPQRRDGRRDGRPHTMRASQPLDTVDRA
jgi:hypothetical protein